MEKAMRRLCNYFNICLNQSKLGLMHNQNYSEVTEWIYNQLTDCIKIEILLGETGLTSKVPLIKVKVFKWIRDLS